MINKDKTTSLTGFCKKYGFIAGVGINSALGFTYLILLNQVATQGFGLEEIKTERLELQKEIEALEISLAIPSSLYALERNPSIQNMPKVGKKTYIEVLEQEKAVAFLPKN